MRGDAVGLLGIRSFVGQPAESRAELSRQEREDLVVTLAIASARIDGEIPRWVIVEASGADVVRHAIVIELADPGRDPAVRAECLRQRHCTGQLLAEVRRHGVFARIRQYTCRVGASPGEKRRAARAAQRILVVGAIESHSARRQPVDVRRSNRAAVGAQVIVQIVCDQKQDVQSRWRRLRLDKH